jgi:hypothetical protein
MSKLGELFSVVVTIIKKVWELTRKTIQKMIAEGVKAQGIQNHYSMRPGYVKPYPPDVDLVPFWQITENMAHLLAPCPNTAQNGALLLHEFVITPRGQHGHIPRVCSIC